MDRFLDGLEPELIRCAIGHAPFDAASGHPDGEPVMVMIAPVVSLGGRRSAKLAAPQNQGIFEQASLLEVS